MNRSSKKKGRAKNSGSSEIVILKSRGPGKEYIKLHHLSCASNRSMFLFARSLLASTLQKKLEMCLIPKEETWKTPKNRLFEIQKKTENRTSFKKPKIFIFEKIDSSSLTHPEKDRHRERLHREGPTFLRARSVSPGDREDYLPRVASTGAEHVTLANPFDDGGWMNLLRDPGEELKPFKKKDNFNDFVYLGIVGCFDPTKVYLKVLQPNSPKKNIPGMFLVGIFG